MSMSVFVAFNIGSKQIPSRSFECVLFIRFSDINSYTFTQSITFVSEKMQFLVLTCSLVMNSSNLVEFHC